MIALLVDSLAAYRLARLARTDAITEPVRDWIEARSVEVVPSLCSCGHARIEHYPFGSDEPVPSGRCGVHLRPVPGAYCPCQEYDGPVRVSDLVDVQPFAFVRDLTDCGWCTTVWTAALVVVLPRRVRRLLAVAALAGVAADAIERASARDDAWWNDRASAGKGDG